MIKRIKKNDNACTHITEARHALLESVARRAFWGNDDPHTLLDMAQLRELSNRTHVVVPPGSRDDPRLLAPAIECDARWREMIDNAEILKVRLMALVDTAEDAMPPTEPLRTLQSLMTRLSASITAYEQARAVYIGVKEVIGR